MRLLPIALLLLGCNENNLGATRLSNVAVVVGDFDDITSSLVALDVGSEPWDGLIVQATYQPEEDRLYRGDMALQVEGLLTDNEGDLDLENYGTVFVSSGTRGLGRVQYNDATKADDGMILDPEIEKACDFASSKGLLVATDWAYDLVEHCWPDAIEFVNDDATVDDAQTGEAGLDVLATVKDELLVADLGEVVSLTYDYSAWAVIESVGAGTEVLMSGDVSYQPDSLSAYETIVDAPLLVRFATGSGFVVFSTFHLSAQNPSVQQSILLNGMDGVRRGQSNTGAASGT